MADLSAVEQQEEAKQRKRHTWGWAFVIGSGLFTLMGICQTIGAIAYSVSSSAAEAVQKSGIIAIVAPLGCNALWLVLWGVLLGLSIKNLQSVLRAEKQPVLGSRARREETKLGMPPVRVQFDASGRVLRVEALQGQWARRQEGRKWYFTQEASSLLQATEILKRLDSIPQLVYYTVDTPDGSLGRDVQGFYTVGPLKTENLVVGSRVGKVETVECVSLRGFGDEMANVQTVALLQSQGEYARLVLLMECGHCGYQSPVETEEGEFFRECYACGTKNRCHRGSINVFLGGNLVTI